MSGAAVLGCRVLLHSRGKQPCFHGVVARAEVQLIGVHHSTIPAAGDATKHPLLPCCPSCGHRLTCIQAWASRRR